MSLIEDIDRKIVGEALLIVGGFALADTLIRKFLELSEGILPWGILPLLAFLVVMTGVNLKENKETPRGVVSVVFLIVSIILIVFSAQQIINVWWFIGVSGIGGIFIFVWTLISWIKKGFK